MKKQLPRLLCLALALVMLAGMIPTAAPRAHAATQSQMNMVARADYMYDATWVCQQTVAGWGGTFYAGNTYHIPYGQPIYSGKYIGYAATVEEFLEAAATAGSIFYTGRSYYTGTTAPYYVSDCSSFVSWCWGISRTTTYYIPSASTKIGTVTTYNCTYNLQLGDALNHPDHVIMVTGLSYDAAGAITQIEITEQTPPQLKRSYYNPAQLADKYSAYTIYRYYGDVPAAPNATPLEGWQLIDGNWYYYVNNEKQTGWLKDNGAWYYLDSNGVMLTGWLDDNGTWYYLGTNGVMQTGWMQIDGEWYYFNPANGVMQTGWIKVDGCWYYMGEWNGIMQRGWVCVDDVWYYLNPDNGVMQTGWITVDGDTYYLNPDGAMVTGTQTIDGITYRFSDTGALIGEVPTLTGKSFSLSFEDEILVNFYYTVSDTADVVEQGMLVFYADPGTVEFAVADEVYTDAVYDETKDRYMNTTAGIAAKEMGDDRCYAAYVKLADGSYAYSALYHYSPKKYAMNMLGKSTTSDAQKALCVAMLNYGAAAQTYFSYNTDSLMNAELTEAQQALVQPYSADLLVGAVAADSSKAGSFVKTDSGFTKKTASVSFDSAFSINYYFTAEYAPEGEMTFYYWTNEDYAAADVLTAANATGTVSMKLSDNGSYWAVVDGIAAKQIDDTVYVAGVYTADGVTYCTGIVAYCLGTYFKKTAAGTSDMQPLAAAAGVYGYYARVYFAAT